MAIFRKIHVSFWSDSFISELTPEQRYFFIYLLTNEKTTQCGIYEITKRQMSFDTGYNTETVSKLLKIFIESGKIRYSENTNEVAIKNWYKYNESASSKVQSCVNKGLDNVKDKSLIEYLYSIDTLPQEEEEREEEQEEKENNATGGYDEFVSILNSATSKNYKGCSKSKKQFSARLKENRTMEEFRLAVENSVKDPYHKENNFRYLTPEFLTRADKLDKFCQFQPVKQRGTVF